MIDSLWPTLTLLSAAALVWLLWLNVVCFTRFRWWARGLATLLVAWLHLAAWQSRPELLGWPARTGVPQRFSLVGIHILEPEKNGSSKGMIYLWVTRFATGNVEVIPRAFEVPFTPELQLKVATAGTRLRKRLPQLGEVVPLKGEAGGHGGPGIDLNFYDMPDPLFPER